MTRTSAALRARALLDRVIGLADEPTDDDDLRLRKRVLVTYRQELHDVTATDEHAIALAMVHEERNGRAIEYRSAEVFHIRGVRATEAWFMNDTPDDEFWS